MPSGVFERVRAVLAEVQRIPEEKITIDSTFEELGMDSLDATNLLFAIEEEFDISIPDEDVRSIETVRQMSEGVEKLVAAKVGGTASPEN